MNVRRWKFVEKIDYWLIRLVLQDIKIEHCTYLVRTYLYVYLWHNTYQDFLNLTRDFLLVTAPHIYVAFNIVFQLRIYLQFSLICRQS